MKTRLDFWVRLLFPFFLTLFLGFMLYLFAQFREPPGFEWQGFAWLTTAIYLLWESGWAVSRRLDRRQVTWQKSVFKRLSMQLLLTNLVGVLLFNATFVVLNFFEKQGQPRLLLRFGNPP